MANGKDNENEGHFPAHGEAQQFENRALGNKDGVPISPLQGSGFMVWQAAWGSASLHPRLSRDRAFSPRAGRTVAAFYVGGYMDGIANSK